MAEFTKLKIGSTAYDMRDAKAVSADAIKDAGRYKGSYASATTYASGDIVASGSTYYKSLQDNNTGHSVSETTWWTPYTTTPGFLNAIDAFSHISGGGGGEPATYVQTAAVDTTSHRLSITTKSGGTTSTEYVVADDIGGLTASSNLNASKLTSGTVGSERLPTANSSEKGAVKPVAKDANMTVDVGVDSEGKLYTTPTDITGKQDSITVNGILRGDGYGTISTAVAGEDYVIPSALSGHTSNTSIHVSSDDRTAWSGKQSLITANGILMGDGEGNVTAAVADTNYVQPSTFSAHTTNTTVHVTAPEKTDWNNKLSDNTADYDPASTTGYAVGAFCKYQGALYCCHTAVEAGGEPWSAAKWTPMPGVSALFTSANTSNNAENVRTSAADATPISTVIAGKITNPSGGSAGNVLKKTADGVEWGTGGGGGTTIQYDSQTGRYYFET